MLWLHVLCAALVGIVAGLFIKTALDRKALREILEELNAALERDTNGLIKISSADRGMARFANALNTQLRKLRDERRNLQCGNRELRDAVTNISHDLRTPLTAISGYLELLEKENLPSPSAKYVMIVQNRVDIMRQLTEELLQYSVAKSAEAYTGRETIALNHEIETCVAAYYGALTERRITPEIQLPSALVKRSLNRAALSRILGNAMSNALRYSDGDLRISLSQDGEISFGNRASRLDAVTLEKLFDRYYTVENGRNRTGLGLSIAKTLTEQMGGGIAAAKEGDVFILRLRFPEQSAEK